MAQQQPLDYHRPEPSPVRLPPEVSDEDMIHSRWFGWVAAVLAVPVAMFLLVVAWRIVVAIGTVAVNLLQ